MRIRKLWWGCFALFVGRRVLDWRRVVQWREGEAIPVVEIACSKSMNEEDEAGRHQAETDEDQENHDIHVSLLPVSRHTVRETMPIELTGMRIAAITGVTTPRKQRATALRL